jgi:hypothetical protein
MHEELMKTLKVPPRDLPILDLFKHGNPAASVEPRGLWIIGANGRLDLITGNEHYIIVDKAENFQDPRWSISNLNDRLTAANFDRNKFLSILEDNA